VKLALDSTPERLRGWGFSLEHGVAVPPPKHLLNLQVCYFWAVLREGGSLELTNPILKNGGKPGIMPDMPVNQPLNLLSGGAGPEPNRGATTHRLPPQKFPFKLVEGGR
jgi:hypothetical protein